MMLLNLVVLSQFGTEAESKGSGARLLLRLLSRFSHVQLCATS